MRKRQTKETTGTVPPESETPKPEERNCVEALAYQLWLQRNCPIGSDQEDWFEAEEQLRTAKSRAA